MEDAFRNQEHTLAVFLDVTGAFDNVVGDILLDILAEIGCSSSILRFIKVPTHKRVIHCETLGNNTRTSHRGLPQGGVLSPLLYTICTRNILRKLSSKVEASLFADDIALYIRLPDFETDKAILENSIDQLISNLKSLGLTIAPEKTVALRFSQKGSPPENTQIRIGEHQTTSSTTARFLGIYFDQKLNFNYQISMIQQRCLKALNIIKFLRRTWWGTDPETLIGLYKSYVRSIIDYGLFAYFPSTKKYRAKLESIQYSAIRFALGYRRSTPTNVLIGESKLMVIEERARFLCKTYLVKVLSNQSTQVYDSISLIFKEKRTKIRCRDKLITKSIREILPLENTLYSNANFPIFLQDYDTLFTSIDTTSDLGINLQSLSSPNEALNHELTNSFNNWNIIYTDGSKDPESEYAGAACHCPGLAIDTAIKLDKHCSVYTTECIALNLVLDIASNHKESSHLVLSDSLSAMQSLKSINCNPHNSQYILEVKKKYRDFNKENPFETKIVFRWIPAHRGIEGNERVDFLAKNAKENSSLHVPATDFKALFKQEGYENTFEFIKAEAEKPIKPKGKFYFDKFWKKNTRPWYLRSQLPRELVVWVNRARSNHYHLNESLWKINIVNSPECSCGDNAETQDINHILWYCPLYTKGREEMIEKLIKLKCPRPYTITAFLASTKQLEPLRIIHKYIQTNKIRI